METVEENQLGIGLEKWMGEVRMSMEERGGGGREVVWNTLS